MIITYHSGGFIKITSSDTTIAFNPISKKSRLKEVKFGADLVFISLNHEDCNGIEAMRRTGKETFVIDGPGEYESAGVFAKGVAAESNYGGQERINTIYSLHLEDLHIVHLGALSTEKLTGKMLEGIDNVDILFVPIGDSDAGILDAGLANKMANTLEAKVIIPVFYSKDTLQTFLKEASAEDVKSIEKLVIKKKDVEDKSGEVIVLSA